MSDCARLHTLARAVAVAALVSIVAAQATGVVGEAVVELRGVGPGGVPMGNLSLPASLRSTLDSMLATGTDVVLELEGGLYSVSRPAGSPAGQVVLQLLGPVATLAGVPGAQDSATPGGGARPVQPGAAVAPADPGSGEHRGLTPSESGGALTVTVTNATTGIITPAVLLIGPVAEDARKATATLQAPAASKPSAGRPAGAIPAQARAGVAGTTMPPRQPPGAAPGPAVAITLPVVKTAPPVQVVVGAPPIATSSIRTSTRTKAAPPGMPPTGAANATSQPATREPSGKPDAPVATPGGKGDNATGGAVATVTDGDTVVAIVDADVSKGSDEGKGGTATGSGAADDQVITVLHFNDWHNRMEPCTESWNELCDDWGKAECSGGLARMKRWLDDARKRHGWVSTLTLNAGDDFIGTVWDRKYGVEQPSHFLPLLGINVSTVGNHEWDWGTDKLVDYLSRLPYPVLGSCNLDIPSGHALGARLRTYTSYSMHDTKVCVLGLATRDVTSDKTWPVKVKDPYYNGKNCVASARKDGCEVVVLLSHLGYTADIVAAQLIPGVDLVVGGHSHSLLWNGDAPQWDNRNGRSDRVWGSYPTWVDSKVEGGRKTPVVQSGWGSRYIGTVRLHLIPREQRKPGGPVIARVEGWPSLLGGDHSDTPYGEDAGVIAEIKKWRYWRN